MSQFQIRAKICVGKKENTYSNQAQISGKVMGQKWRSYGISDIFIVKIQCDAMR